MSDDHDPVARTVASTVRRTLDDHLPTSGRIALLTSDHETATWLADRGCEVLRVVSPERVGTAREATRDADVAVRVVAGEPRALPFDDDAVDACCWLGDGSSAYLEKEARTDAIGEITRVVPESQPIAVGAVGRLAALRVALAWNPSAVAADATDLFDDGAFTADRLGLTDGAHSPFGGRVPFYGYRRQGLTTELVHQDLVVRQVVGLDGLLLDTGDAIDTASDEDLSALDDAVQRASTDRAVADTSFRLLAVGRTDTVTEFDDDFTLGD